MEIQKSSESTSSSSGEIPERTKAKTEKTYQKITLPTFEKRGIQEAKLWRRRFTYIKMTQNIDLNEMTTDREILPNHRDDLEHRIKDLFIWALGESAITEMTRTVRDNDPNKMDINQVYSLFRLHFIPERNKFYSRANFFGITREKRNSRRCVDQNITSRKELRVRECDTSWTNSLKILSVIGRSTGDYELKKKNRKSNMTIETITTLIHEHMYDRLNESNNSIDGKVMKHVQGRTYKKSGQINPIKRTWKDEWKIKDINNDIIDVDNAAHQTGQDNTCARRKWQNVETVKGEDITRKCADPQKEYNTLKKQPHQQRKTTGITTKYKE